MKLIDEKFVVDKLKGIIEKLKLIKVHFSNIPSSFKVQPSKSFSFFKQNFVH